MSSSDIDMAPIVRITSIDHETRKSYEKENVEEHEDHTGKSYNRKNNVKDGGWGWVIVIASFFSHMISDGIVYAYGVLAPEYINHFGIQRSTVGWLGSVMVAVTLGTGLLSGYLCNRFSYRKVAIAGSIISVIGFGAPCFYPRLWFLIFSASLVCGIGFGLVYVPSILIVNMWFEKKRSFAIGIAVCGSGLGTFVFSTLFEYLLELFGWQETMLISAGILLLLIPCSLTYSDFDCDNTKYVCEKNESNEYVVEMNLLSKNNVERNIEDNLTELKENNNLKNEKECKSKVDTSMASYIEIIKNPIFILYLISTVSSSIGFNAPYMFAKDRAMQYGINASRGSFLISSIGIGNCLGRVGFGYLATLKCVNRFHLYNITRIISGLILIVSWWATNYGLMITYTLIYGMMAGAFVTLTSIILGDIFGVDKLDITFGLSLLFQGASVLLGPPLAGFIYDMTLSYNISFAVCGVFIGISGIMMYLGYVSSNFRKKIFR